jgi:hypothetical protein
VDPGGLDRLDLGDGDGHVGTFQKLDQELLKGRSMPFHRVVTIRSANPSE